MFSPVEAFVGSRYIFARRGHHFIAFISLTSIIGTALGVAVLLTVMSIMNGFENELRARILGMAAHVAVRAPRQPAGIWQEHLEQIRADPRVRAVSTYLSRDVLIARGGIVRAVEVRGVMPDRERRLTTIDAHTRAGGLEALSAGAFNIVLGSELAGVLGAVVGDEVEVITPRPIVTPAGMLARMKSFTVGGIYEFGINEHDAGLSLTHIEDARRLFRGRGQIDGIRIMLEDAAHATLYKAALTRLLERDHPRAVVEDWTDTHRNLFRALKTEKIVMFVILAIAIAIAAFNVVSTMVMAVSEKGRDISILVAQGLERGRVMRVFLIQGVITGTLGVFAGLALGIILAVHIDHVVSLVERAFDFKVLSPEIYYISDIPSQLETGDVVLTAILALVLSLGAPIYPAWLASRTDPAEGLRHG